MIDVPATLTLILSGLRAAVGAYMAQRQRTPSVVWLGTRAYLPVVAPQTPAERIIAAISTETWTLLWHRLGRIANRFQALYNHWRAGTLPKPAAPRPRRPSRPPASRPPAPRLPTRQTWIVAAIGYQAAGRAAHLNILMAEPEFNAFIAAVPRAGRLLRPLCHSLGIPLPPALRLPPRSTPARPRKLAPPRPPPLPPLLPLAPIGFRPPLPTKSFSTP